MTPEEAKAEAVHLFGLFPSITGEQGRFWTREFQRYDRSIVREAIDRYHRDHAGGFVAPAGLLGAISREIGRREHARVRMDAIEAGTIAYWQDVDRLIEATPDDELQCWRDTLLGDPAVHVDTRKLLEKRDVRKSRTLQGMVYNAITKQVKGAA